MTGPTAALPTAEIKAACLRLCLPTVRVRDFWPASVRFVQQTDEEFSLTDEGLWLTGLMK